MNISELRQQIDTVDGELIALLERRMDISAGIAEYKRENGLAVLDAARESEKLDAVRAGCRPETAEHIASVFTAILAASRAYQTALLGEARDG